MAEGDNRFPTDSARDRSVLKHDWKKMIYDIIFENNLVIKFCIEFFNIPFIRFNLMRIKRKILSVKKQKETIIPRLQDNMHSLIKASVVTNIMGL